jgi:hypothetical protein
MGMDIWDVGCWARAAMLHNSSVKYRMRFNPTPREETGEDMQRLSVPLPSVRGVELSDAQRWDE